jgi:tetratricopeptide (TPR) repeat protein
MQRRHLLKTKIRKLVSEFEERTHSETLTYFDEKELIEIISFYEREQLLHKAIDAVDIALTQYEYRIEFYLLKARLLLKDKDYSNALSLLERAEAISPIEMDIQLMKARTLNSMGLPLRSLEILESLRARNSKSEWVEIMLVEALVYEQLKDYDSMFDIMKDTLKMAPSRKEALERMWMAVEFSKKYEESVHFHAQLIENDPYNAYAWYNLGHAHACLGDYEEAIEALEYSFLIEENFEMGYKDCAELCMQTCKFKKALDIYLDELKKFGPDSDILASIGECFIKIDGYANARKYLSQAVKLDPYNDEVYYLLAQCYATQEKWDTAIDFYQKALDIEDRREEYFAGIANAYSQVGEITKADYFYRKATEAGPEQMQYWLDHANFLFDIEVYSEAINVLEEAEYHTVGVELLYCKAACLFRSDQKKEALVVLEDALREDVTQQELLYQYADELRELPEVQSMIDYFIGEIPL